MRITPYVALAGLFVVATVGFWYAQVPDHSNARAPAPSVTHTPTVTKLPSLAAEVPLPAVVEAAEAEGAVSGMTSPVIPPPTEHEADALDGTRQTSTPLEINTPRSAIGISEVEADDPLRRSEADGAATAM